MTVLVIVGILIAFTVPAITNLSRSAALPGALRQISNEAGLARQYAITHRVQTELKITNIWTAVTVLTNGFPVDKWNYLPAGTIVYFPLPPASPPANLVTNVFFSPTGGTTYGNEVTICAREGSFENGNYFGTNSNVGTITINSLLGRIAIQRP